MKNGYVTLAIVVSVTLVWLSGCRAKETTSNTSTRPTTSPVTNGNATDNSNQTATTASSNRNADRTSPPSDSAKAKTPPQLIGTYESREVHSSGVVTVISKLRTIWMFSADGNYSRVSQVNG